MRESETKSGEGMLVLDSNVAELERLEAFISGFCETEGVPEEISYQLQVALEELVLNAIKYGGCNPTKGAIRLAIKKEGGEVSAVLSDNGAGFNPLDMPPPDLTKSVLDRPVGGLGIHLVRHLIPSIRYERREERNYLYLTKPVKLTCALSQEEETHANGDGDNQN
jgi:serine/threonine-protein kinase RsbW